ncbi:MAG: FkbM family methyltransferase [Deltaproteobacteria bacterium]|nr:FkbM family methyltransferase [Deltaproteobacteria bacterium]
MIEAQCRDRKKINKPQFFEIHRTEKFRHLSLQDALAKTDLPSIDFMKIDIEGAELEVLCPLQRLQKFYAPGSIKRPSKLSRHH